LVSDFLQPHITQQHALVLPVVFGAVNEPNLRIAKRALFALESFCENMDPDEIRPYLHPLMERLVVLLRTGDLQTQEVASSCVSSCAAAARAEFLPYFPTIIAMMRVRAALTLLFSL
jgi:hypothetical protein